MGGENAGVPDTAPIPEGSSPRGRGKRYPRRNRRRPARLIPAWAGKTRLLRWRSGWAGAHPRVGGENRGVPPARRNNQGSSPRGRGKRRDTRPARTSTRLIPAWAGKTLYVDVVPSMRGAHPRVGGENSAMPAPMALSAGSSPRGRGKREQRLAGRVLGGLIPAWAGKTHPIGYQALGTRAHPRVGGENRGGGCDGDGGEGSSPRGRGKRGRPRTRKRCRRLIPAWAGKTSRGSSWPQQRGAHPRVGGENGYLSVFRVTGLGSSPRGRGKRDLRRVKGVTTGLIPAWAGKTAGYGARAGRGRAHPRVGGENLRMPSRPQSKTGSSPRGRGKRRDDALCLADPGLIPAWAGKTIYPAMQALAGFGSSPRGRGKRRGPDPQRL